MRRCSAVSSAVEPDPARPLRRIGPSPHRNADLDARHIAVAVSDDVVTLTGTVGSWSQYEAAERGAGSAPGIRLVSQSDSCRAARTTRVRASR
jgi:hypothetical protein